MSGAFEISILRIFLRTLVQKDMLNGEMLLELKFEALIR